MGMNDSMGDGQEVIGMNDSIVDGTWIPNLACIVSGICEAVLKEMYWNGTEILICYTRLSAI